MKNIPIFTACGGTASLILSEVPRWKRAYVMIQTQTPGEESAQAASCADFCRQVGAQEVFLTCRDGTELPRPHAYDMQRHTLPRSALPIPARKVTLIPLDAKTTPVYIDAYNRRFAAIPGAAAATPEQLARAAAAGSRQFLVAGPTGDPVGLGEIRGGELRAVASLRRGWGADVTAALLQECEGDPLTLTVCSTNRPALALYRRLGFVCAATVSRWFRG